MTTMEIMGQVCGLISLVFAVCSYQVKNPRRTMLLFAPTDFFYGLQYLFLGSVSSFWVMMAAMCRDLAGAFAAERIMRYVFIAYIVLVWVIAFAKAEAMMEFLAPLATSLATIAGLYRESFFRFRVFLFLHHVAWMTFNIWILSYAGILMICFTGSANIISFFRFIRAEKAEKADAAA